MTTHQHTQTHRTQGTPNTRARARARARARTERTCARAHRHTHTDTHTDTHTQTHTQRHTHRDTHRHAQTRTDTHRHTHTQAHTGTQTHTARPRDWRAMEGPGSVIKSPRCKAVSVLISFLVGEPRLVPLPSAMALPPGALRARLVGVGEGRFALSRSLEACEDELTVGLNLANFLVRTRLEVLNDFSDEEFDEILVDLKVFTVARRGQLRGLLEAAVGTVVLIDASLRGGCWRWWRWKQRKGLGL